MTYIPKTSPIYNKSTSRRRTSPTSSIHVGPLSARAKQGASLASGIYSSNKTGNKTGLVSSLFGGMFGGGGSGGGLGGFFSNIFSSGDKMMGFGSILGAVGSFLGGLDDTEAKLTARRLDIEEELGREGLRIKEELGKEELRINEMRAKDAIRQTGLSNMYMGWTPKQADVPGIFEGTPGLVVGDAPTEVASNNAGIIGGSNQGMITQAQQRQV